MVSLDATLAPLESRIAPALIDAVAFERLHATAAQLPAALSNRVYLECRAGEMASQVDFIVGVDAQGRDCLLDGAGAPRRARRLRGTEGWRRARALAAAWANPRSVLHHAIGRLWLEFDLDDGAYDRGIERPGIFVDFARDTDRDPSRDIQVAVIHETLGAGGAAGKGELDALQTCIAAMPNGASVVYLGLFPERCPPAVRVCVAGLHVADVEPFLGLAGWRGSTMPLRRLLTPLAAGEGADRRARTVLHLDIVGSAVAARVGAERGFARASQLHGHINECDVLDTLVSLGWCSTDKRRALNAWPGVDVMTLPHDWWPSLITRRLNHLKVVGGDGADPSVKLYLSVGRDRLAAFRWSQDLERALRTARRETTQHSI